jgi:SAM-dependent methyltransferase
MMDEKRKTDKALWEIYWKTYVPISIERNSTFSQLFEKQPNGTNKRFLEIGGFPGIFAIWFHKYKNYNVSLLDFYVSNDVTEKLLITNSLPTSTIEVIETDLFNYEPLKKFDLVFSLGFIEHFENTNLVVKKHVDCLVDGGKLLITLPNLKGINGWVQRKFDIANYNIHVIECMDINVLKSAAIEAGLKNISVYYYGKPMVWLEPKAPVTAITRKLIRMLSMAIKLVPLRGKLISSYLVIEGTK